MANETETTILSERESRLAVVLFEIMKPQIKKLIDQLIIENNQSVQTITDQTINEQIDRKLNEKESSEFDLSDHVSEIKDIVEEIIRYDLTFTTTVD